MTRPQSNQRTPKPCKHEEGSDYPNGDPDVAQLQVSNKDRVMDLEAGAICETFGAGVASTALELICGGWIESASSSA